MNLNPLWFLDQPIAALTADIMIGAYEQGRQEFGASPLGAVSAQLAEHLPDATGVPVLGNMLAAVKAAAIDQHNDVDPDQIWL